MSEEEAIVGNVADSEQIKKGKKKERRKRQDQLNDIRQLLRTEFGKRFLWRYLSKCRIFETLQGPLPDIHYHEGYRQVGWDLMHDIIEANPSALIEMMVAAMAEDKNNT